MASEPVTVELIDHVLMIGINRPEKRNAFDLATIDAFGAAYERLADDPQARVAVVFGHGGHFSAGLDLAEVGPAVAAQGPGRSPAPDASTRLASSPRRCPNRWWWRFPASRTP